MKNINIMNLFKRQDELKKAQGLKRGAGGQKMVDLRVEKQNIKSSNLLRLLSELLMNSKKCKDSQPLLGLAHHYFQTDQPNFI